MSMSSGPATATAGSGNAPMVDMNTTPLVDVMLVLLIIFMITAPLLAHKVRINLPQQSPIAQDLSRTQLRHLELRELGGAVEIRLDNEPISQQQLMLEFRQVGSKPRDEQDRYQLVADETIPFSAIADLLATARRAQVERIGFAELESPSAPD